MGVHPRVWHLEGFVRRDEKRGIFRTVRLRLDRLIAKVTVFENLHLRDDFERQLRAFYAEGKLAPGAFKKILAAYRKSQT